MPARGSAVRAPAYRNGEVIRPGDTFTIDGARDRLWTVERIEYSLYGWTIWDTDGNDRPPDNLILDGRPGQITITMEFDFTNLLAQLDQISAILTDVATEEQLVAGRRAARVVAGKIRTAVDAELKRKAAS